MGKCKISVIGAIVLLFSSVVSVSAQTSFTVSGTVRDSGGDVLPGVAVMCKENNKSVSTDLNGHYQIAAASASSILEFSFIGMKDKAVPVNKRQILDVVMEYDATLLEAAVSVGYGVIQKRDDFTGSAVQVTKEQIALKPAERIDNLLVGMVPGMNVIEESTSGRPSVKIRIRGDGSLSASNEPLWIIDGVPIFQGTKTNSVTGTSATVSPLSYMNPDDIESITVLKDASTTTLYGADGSNGVILVTTKRGTTGKASVTATASAALQTISKFIDFTDSYTYGKMWNYTQITDVLPMSQWPGTVAISDYTPYTDTGIRFSQDVMAVRLQKEPRPISWRVYVPMRAE